jgi:hypothetical protein
MLFPVCWSIFGTRDLQASEGWVAVHAVEAARLLLASNLRVRTSKLGKSAVQPGIRHVLGCLNVAIQYADITSTRCDSTCFSETRYEV